jgi:hypothetical protein
MALIFHPATNLACWHQLNGIVRAKAQYLSGIAVNQRSTENPIFDCTKPPGGEEKSSGRVNGNRISEPNS